MAVDPATRTSSTRGGRHAASRRSKPRKPKRGFFRRYWWVFLAVPVLGALTAFGTLLFLYTRLSLPAAPPPLQTSYLYDRDGELITSLHATVDRTIIPLSQMPESLRNAVIATEDKDFYSHSGFDPVGIARAAWNDVRGNPIQGGSTITQQLVKNVYAGRYKINRNGERVYVPPPRTVGQKIREVLLAIKLEKEMGKDKILATYLNTIYFGHGAYGVEAAAETYWHKSARNLSPLESATLAGAIASPETFDPVDNPENSKVRRDYVLDRMAQEGYLTQRRADHLKRKDVTTEARDEGPVDYEAPYFVDYSKGLLEERYGSSDVFGGGLKITTTLDSSLQQEAEDAVRTHLPDPKDPEGALVAVDPRTGEILAMVGGRDFDRSKVNLATGEGGSGRAAGSAFKPFTLATAMKQNYDLDSTWNGPPTIRIPDRECYGADGPWTPSNAADEESGTFSLADATKYSVNTVYAQLVTQVGPENVVETAHDLGITSKLAANCSITLGAVNVNPLEMTSAYATFAARGIHRRPTPLLDVRGPDGEALPTGGKKEEKEQKALSSNDAALVTYALQGVVEGGTGTAAALADGRDLAGKTGTAQDYSDAWFCGYTPQLATCVWVGYPKENRPLYVEGIGPVFGGTIPAAIFHDFMTAAMEGRRVIPFAAPTFDGYDKGPSTAPPVSTPVAPTPSPTETATEESPSPKPSHSPTESPSPDPTATDTEPGGGGGP